MNKTNLTDEPYHFLNESISEIDILKRKNAFLEQILNELPIAVYVHDSKNMQQVWGNTQAETRMGISTKEMNDRGIDWFLNQFHPDDIGVINENIKAFSDNKSNEFSGFRSYCCSHIIKFYFFHSTATITSLVLPQN